MMLYLYVQQNQWIVTTLLVGVALMLIFCLTYQAMWHPRGTERKSGETAAAKRPQGFFPWLLSFVPWVIILIVLGTVTFTIATVASKACRPPNW